MRNFLKRFLARSFNALTGGQFAKLQNDVRAARRSAEAANEQLGRLKRELSWLSEARSIQISEMADKAEEHRLNQQETIRKFRKEKSI
jgi:hypothetical protein